MRVLLDTNVLVSAILRDRGPQEVILWIAEHPGWEWVVSGEILDEYHSVLRREKFGLPAEILLRWDELIERVSLRVEVSGAIEFPRDQKDAPFLACALSSQANYFVTGDRDFHAPGKFGETTILSVALFRRLVMGSA
jgi:putative PIN family toxin of toxin-antitoxin system